MTHRTAYVTKTDTLNVFFTNTTTTLTLLDEAFTDLPEADATNRNPTPVTKVTIPYIKSTSETISQILQPYYIRVAHKSTTTLRHLLTNVKDRDEPNNRQGAVYKIKCSDC